MTDFLMTLLETWGIGAIIFALFIEGSSFPFIGTYFIIAVGFIVEFTWIEIIVASLLGSLFYTIGSFIPYFIGLKLGESLEKRLSASKKASMVKVKGMMNKYGKWSIAVLSPLHLGNVIPFLAGMSSVKLGFYTVSVMVGIAPTTFIFLAVGKLFNGDSDTIIQLISEYQTAFLIALVILTGLFIGYKFIKRKKRAEKSL